MNTIKFNKNKTITLNNKVYTEFTLDRIPSYFGFIYNDDKEQDGASEWFNYKGLTYIQTKKLF